MLVRDIGTTPYRDAWAIQERAHTEVLAGGEEQLILVEHPPVITFGRRAHIQGRANLIASDEQLARLGVEVVQSDRGGDVTFHGPGQIVAYPIVPLNDHKLSVGGYVRRLEEIVIETLATFGIAARKDAEAIGVWTQINAEGRMQKAEGEMQNAECRMMNAELQNTLPASVRVPPTAYCLPPTTACLPPTSTVDAKICALGVRIRRGVSLHGIALNVNTNLSYFNLIVPCGLAGRAVTSMRQLLGDATPSIDSVKDELARRMTIAFDIQCDRHDSVTP